MKRQRSLKVELVLSSPSHATKDPHINGNGSFYCYQVPPWITNAVHEGSTLVATLFPNMKTLKNKEDNDHA
jgi:hypothetical protein